MYDQIKEDTLYIMLYTVVTAMAMIASCYLLFRRGNAFAPELTSPARLRRWTAAFFAVITLNHLWYLPIFFLTSSEDIRMCDLVGGLLDSMTVFPLAIVVLFAMLQDRKRLLWPIAVMFAPLVVGNALCVATCSYALLPIIYIYFFLMCIGLIIYMVREVRRYGRWLRDNYADLEHKEVWQSFAVLAIVLLVFGIYAFIYEGLAYLYAMQVIGAMFICYLLWRVETLSDLSIPLSQNLSVAEPAITEAEDVEGTGLSQTNLDRQTLVAMPAKNVEALLQQHCIDTQLYLQHDLTIIQLAKAIGTNRTYLSQYFISKDTTYNAYINNLRINHFVSLYREAVATQRSVSAKQLASDSGYRSYSTFALAFKQRMGQPVMAWMRDFAV
jgi:AraC-like DNA-binding protein